MSNSIGLIESKGLVALIEAADVILKNSPVKILGIHKLQNGLVTLAVSGNTDYVKAAIESGTEAGRRVGEIHSFSVVDNPDKVLLDIFRDLFPDDALTNLIHDDDPADQQNYTAKSLNENSDNFTIANLKQKNEFKREKSKPLQVTKITPILKKKKAKSQSNQEAKIISDELSVKKIEDDEIESDEINKTIDIDEEPKPISTIERLRLEALGTAKKENKLNEKIVSAQKKKEKDDMQIIENSNVDFEAISQMNVHKLRHYARAFPNFPIKGREISRANRNELVELFKNIKHN